MALGAFAGTTVPSMGIMRSIKYHELIPLIISSDLVY